MQEAVQTMRPTTIRWAMTSTISATIGDRSSGPTGGMRRRKKLRYQSVVSWKNCTTAIDQRRIGAIVIHDIRIRIRMQSW